MAKTGSTQATGQTQYEALGKALIPVAAQRYEAKVAKQPPRMSRMVGGVLVLMKPEEAHAMGYIEGYADAAWDLLSGKLKVKAWQPTA